MNRIFYLLGAIVTKDQYFIFVERILNIVVEEYEIAWSLTTKLFLG